jgi:ribosomal protein L29
MSKNFNKYKAMSKKELAESLVEMKKELMKLRSQVATKTVPEKPSKIRELRRNMARIISILNTEEGKPQA